MQTVWSRAASTPSSCRCISCLSTAAAITRRATTSTIRRRLKVGDTFTAFYSAIFATAALVDAKIKGDRRNDLDRMIEETREDLGTIQETVIRKKDVLDSRTDVQANPGSEAPRSWAHVLEETGLDRNLNRTRVEQQFSVGRLSKELGGDFAHETKKRDAGPGERLPIQCGSVLGIQEGLRTVNAAGIDTSTDAVSQTAPALSEQKRRNLENSIANLASRLLECSIRHYSVEMRHPGIYDTRIQKADVLHDLKEDLILLREIERLQVPHRQRRYPCYTPQEPPVPLGDVEEMNSTIRKICRRSITGRIQMDAVIPKICYRLLVATTPPNVDTYNILIIYLTRMRRNKLVDIVLDSMLKTGQIPNEVTISSIIKFYTASGNRDGFSQLSRLMKGHDGGLLHGYQGSPDSDADGLRQSHLVPRNIVMFGAAINASLKLGTARQAQHWYLEMVREGYTPTPPILTSILQSCALKREWLSGWTTWLTLKEIWQSGTISDNFPWVAYSWMLKLCCWCNRRAEFEQIFKEAVQKGLNPIVHPPAMKTKGLPVRNRSKCPSTEEIREDVYQNLRYYAKGSNLSLEEAWETLRAVTKGYEFMSFST